MVYTTGMKYFCLKIQIVQKEFVSYVRYPDAIFFIKEKWFIQIVEKQVGTRGDKTR